MSVPNCTNFGENIGDHRRATSTWMFFISEMLFCFEKRKWLKVKRDSDRQSRPECTLLPCKI